MCVYRNQTLWEEWTFDFDRRPYLLVFECWCFWWYNHTSNDRRTLLHTTKTNRTRGIVQKFLSTIERSFVDDTSKVITWLYILSEEFVRHTFHLIEQFVRNIVMYKKIIRCNTGLTCIRPCGSWCSRVLVFEYFEKYIRLRTLSLTKTIRRRSNVTWLVHNTRTLTTKLQYGRCEFSCCSFVSVFERWCVPSVGLFNGFSHNTRLIF